MPLLWPLVHQSPPGRVQSGVVVADAGRVGPARVPRAKKHLRSASDAARYAARTEMNSTMDSVGVPEVPLPPLPAQVVVKERVVYVRDVGVQAPGMKDGCSQTDPSMVVMSKDALAQVIRGIGHATTVGEDNKPAFSLGSVARLLKDIIGVEVNSDWVLRAFS